MQLEQDSQSGTIGLGISLLLLQKLICRSAGIEKAKHCITFGADGIDNRTAMTPGKKKANDGELRIEHQLWDARAKGTATC